MRKRQKRRKLIRYTKEWHTVQREYGRQPAGELARQLGVSKAAVHQCASAYGLTRKTPRWTARELTYIRQHQDMTDAEISRRLSMLGHARSAIAVARFRMRHGLRKEPPRV